MATAQRGIADALRGLGTLGEMLSAEGTGPNRASGAQWSPLPAHHPPACHQDLLTVLLPLLPAALLAWAGLAPAQPPLPAAPRERRGLGELIYYWPT